MKLWTLFLGLILIGCGVNDYQGECYVFTKITTTRQASPELSTPEIDIEQTDSCGLTEYMAKDIAEKADTMYVWDNGRDVFVTTIRMSYHKL